MVRRSITRSTIIIFLVIAIFQSGCALLTGGNVSVPKAKNYQVSPPKEWKSIPRGDSDSAYRLPSGPVATVNSSCTHNSKAEPELLTRHLLIGARNINYLDQHRIEVAKQSGLWSEVEATYDGAPAHLCVFVISRNGCIFDFSLIANRNLSGVEKSAFETFVRSFR